MLVDFLLIDDSHAPLISFCLNLNLKSTNHNLLCNIFFFFF